MDFQVGDRVLAVATRHRGVYGTVVRIDDDPDLPIAVRHDQLIELGHDCNNLIENGYGWYYNPEDLKLIDRSVECRITSITDLI